MMPVTKQRSLVLVGLLLMKTKGLYTTRLVLFGMTFLSMLLPSIVLAQTQPNTEHVNDYCQSPNPAQLEQGLYELNSDSHMDAISKRGFLRVLLVKNSNGCSVSNIEKELLEQFASSHDLDVKWVYVENEWNLLPGLLADKGDIIIGQHNKFSTGMDRQLDFTFTWTNASLQIVQRANSGRISKLEDLAGRQVAAYSHSDAWSVLSVLDEKLPGFVLEEIPADMTYLDVMQRVSSGEYDLAVADSLFLKSYLPYHQDLIADFSLTSNRSMAWAIPSDSNLLKTKLNTYLGQQHVTHDVTSVYFDDMSGIRERGILRVITSSNPSHYYLHNGNLYGFEYELIKHFAEQERLRVDVIVARTRAEMFRLLREGKGDIIAASLPAGLMQTDKRIGFTAPYSYGNPVLIGRDSDAAVLDMRELDGRRVTLPADSPYWDYMLELQEQGADFELVRAEPGINMEGTLLMVALGMYDLTVIGNHQYKNRFSNTIGVTSVFNLSEPIGHRWAARANNTVLLRSLNNYIENSYRGEHYNVLHARYFERETLPKASEYNTSRISSLSPFDAKIQKYANEYGFDWRLITALMFQESRFNPSAESDVGAEGLMQLIPTTAELMGVSDTEHPETSINAGIRYLDYLRGKFEKGLALEDRMWFTLASYNAGYGRVKYARQLATEMGLDANRWFNNVELAMMKMAEPYKREGETRRRCRCGQTVVYVREIRTRYFNYIRLTESLRIASADGYLAPASTRIN